jgi:hypothetical protein
MTSRRRRAHKREMTEEEEFQLFHAECARVRSEVGEQLELLWREMEVLDEVSTGANFIGRISALMREVVFLRAHMKFVQDTEQPPDEDRESFMELAKMSWDTFNPHRFRTH